MRRSLAGRRAGRRGQSLVEYAVTVPVFLLVLLGMLEFGFAFSHHLTMEYATREGARTGAALASGSTPFKCSDPDPDNVVDNQVIAAVQRVLTGAARQVDLARVSEIHIYKAGSTGSEGGYELWVPGNGPTVDGTALRFKRSGSVSGGYPCTARTRNSAPAGSYPDSIGVSLKYTYDFVTPLAALMRLGGSASLPMADRTVMALNPTPQ